MQIASFLCLLLLSVPALSAQQLLVRAERCGSCHPFEYQMWKSSQHAFAHNALSEQQLKDTKCNTCHSKDTIAVGVQCEHCHGNGQYYHPRYVMRDKELVRLLGLVDPGEVQCRQCHNEGAPNVVPFNYATFWARIDHSKEARLKWEASQHKN